VVTRLRQAGAIVLGKTNMTEFANFMGQNMPAGYSSRGGQVLSPYNRACSPSGSSTGSAVAVAARLGAAALGMENFGSINYPAQANGIVGIKQTMGLVSRYGNVPTTYTLDTIGPMACLVLDAAIVLGAIAGRDKHDPATWAQGSGESTDYTEFLDGDGLEGARIGIFQESWDALSGARQDAFERLRSTLEDAGTSLVHIEDVSQIISEGEIDPVFFCECRSCMNAYLSTLRPDLTCTSLQDIIAFNQRNAARALKYGQPMLLHAENQTSGAMTEPEYLASLVRREEAIQALDQVLETHPVDVLLCTQPEIVASITGFPSMSLPIGQEEDEMPFGCYWIARRYDEATMLRIAFAVEQRLGVRLTPQAIA
jgi:amidase